MVIISEVVWEAQVPADIVMDHYLSLEDLLVPEALVVMLEEMVPQTNQVEILPLVHQDKISQVEQVRLLAAMVLI